MSDTVRDRKLVEDQARELVGQLRETFDRLPGPGPHAVRAHWWKERYVELWVEAQVCHKILLLAVGLVDRGELSPADLPNLLLDLANRLEFVTKEVNGARPERPVGSRPRPGPSGDPAGTPPPADAR